MASIVAFGTVPTEVFDSPLLLMDADVPAVDARVFFDFEEPNLAHASGLPLDKKPTFILEPTVFRHTTRGDEGMPEVEFVLSEAVALRTPVLPTAVGGGGIVG